MKTRLFFVGLAALALLLPASAANGSQEEPAESILLQGGGMGNIEFPHGRHQGVDVDCRPCHEMFPKEPQVIDKMKAENKLKKKDVMNMCKDCHTERVKKGEKAGPVKCKDCHKK